MHPSILFSYKTKVVRLSAAEHLCLTWMIRETVHAGWSQDFSLGKLTDALTDEGPVVDGDAG